MSIRQAIKQRLERHGIWWHWVNDNDKPGGTTGHIAREGRLIVHSPKGSYRLSWNHWAHFAHAYVSLGGEDDIVMGIAVPPVAYWISIGRLPRAIMDKLPWNFKRENRKYRNPRRTGLSVHDAAIWWDVWADDHECDWKGKVECFCHKGPKWTRWPEVAT